MCGFKTFVCFFLQKEKLKWKTIHRQKYKVEFWKKIQKKKVPDQQKLFFDSEYNIYGEILVHRKTNKTIDEKALNKNEKTHFIIFEKKNHKHMSSPLFYSALFIV